MRTKTTASHEPARVRARCRVDPLPPHLWRFARSHLVSTTSNVSLVFGKGPPETAGQRSLLRKRPNAPARGLVMTPRWPNRTQAFQFGGMPAFSHTARSGRRAGRRFHAGRDAFLTAT